MLVPGVCVWVGCAGPLVCWATQEGAGGGAPREEPIARACGHCNPLLGWAPELPCRGQGASRALDVGHSGDWGLSLIFKLNKAAASVSSPAGNTTGK